MYNQYDFSDIAPFDDDDFSLKMNSLVLEPGFEHAVRFVMPDVDYPRFAEKLKSIKDKDAFQKMVMAPFLVSLAEKTTSGITCGGLEYMSPSERYTIMSNHRDIVLDASFLNLCLIDHGLPTSEIAIGSNLLIFEWITDLVKLNKSFIVKRNLELKKALEAARQLSAYIHYAINYKHENVWIAQREGRAKDSNDRTQEGLLKMLSLEGDAETFIGNLKSINIMPLSISYEYDPNDYLKAREFLLKKLDPDFKKSQHDDLLSMETGILQSKGRVHFQLSPCINNALNGVSLEKSKTEALNEVCDIIDRAIHTGYKIYPINYVAYDRLHHSDRFAACYTETEARDFDDYVEMQLSKVDLSDISKPDMEFMREMMLTMYANPLQNKIAAEAVSKG